MFFTCIRKNYCVYSPSMFDVVDASKQDDYRHKYRIFYFYFFLSPMCASCLVRNMLYCIQTIYCKGSGESAHMRKLV